MFAMLEPTTFPSAMPGEPWSARHRHDQLWRRSARGHDRETDHRRLEPGLFRESRREIDEAVSRVGQRSRADCDEDDVEAHLSVPRASDAVPDCCVATQVVWPANLHHEKVANKPATDAAVTSTCCRDVGRAGSRDIPRPARQADEPADRESKAEGPCGHHSVR